MADFDLYELSFDILFQPEQGVPGKMGFPWFSFICIPPSVYLLTTLLEQMARLINMVASALRYSSFLVFKTQYVVKCVFLNRSFASTDILTANYMQLYDRYNYDKLFVGNGEKTLMDY